ncbi:hypothetical protein KHQ81_13215 [Mycoplasmatota bacterium]|nr:hypothetical protein KHQ81_13215 [Mycoplasmatota bacterium]
MRDIFYRLNRIRILRNILFLSAFIFFMLVMLINHIMTKEEWLYALLIFDNVIVLVILIYFIEVKVGKDYSILYSQEFIPLLLKSISPNFHYEITPREFKGSLINVFDYDSKININHLVHMKDSLNEYWFYDAQVYYKSSLLNKIVQFKGYIIVLPIKNEEDLIICQKKFYLGCCKELNELNFRDYKVYNKSHQVLNLDLFNRLKQVILKYPKLESYASLNHKMMIFKSNRISFFRKPIFKKINQSFFEFKKDEFEKINDMVVNFIKCYK